MGQKSHPRGFRLAISHDWDSVWFSNDKQEFSNLLLEDIKIRQLVEKQFGRKASVSRVLIKRTAKKNAIVNIFTAKPGMIIGKKGEGIELLKSLIKKQLGSVVDINIEEIKQPELNAKLVADQIAIQIEKRVPFRKAITKPTQNIIKLGALGYKVEVSGRLNGAEIARSENHRKGSVSLHTLRANIDYAESRALTTYGITGVKVWIYKGLLNKNAVTGKKKIFKREDLASGFNRSSDSKNKLDNRRRIRTTQNAKKNEG